MSRKPPLTDEDEELWSRYTKSVTPMHPKKSVGFTSNLAPKKKRPAASHPLQSPKSNSNAAPVRQMIDGATSRKLRRGKLPVDGRIDLHGLRQNEAYDALHRFIHASSAKGRRCVLVITGKGRSETRDGYEQPGVLRRKVPDWLQTGSLAPLIVGFETAHIRDGGDGALYVLLRRKR